MADKRKSPGKKRVSSRKYDSAWKEIIKQLFKDFLEFFFPRIFRAIDFTKEIQFLDKELKYFAKVGLFKATLSFFCKT